MAASQNSVVHKYLQHYAEPEIRFSQLVNTQFDHVLCLPAYREDSLDIFKVTRNRQPEWGSLLCVLVCNSPPGQGSETRAGMCELLGSCSSTALTDSCELISADAGLSYLVVDRCSEGREIPLRQGVGLARKIAADIALALIHDQTVRTPWICVSDADSVLPGDYFSAIGDGMPGSEVSLPALEKTAALLWPFHHEAANGYDVASALYEIGMHHYTLGLLHAGSPYAHQALGSILTINSEHYARVRGFPRRSAAEDFYLLEKLAKSGAIVSLSNRHHGSIEICARPSDRVPFGTGPGIRTIAALEEPLLDYQYYCPELFDLLGTLIHCNLQRPEQRQMLDPDILAWLERSGLLKHVIQREHIPPMQFRNFIDTWFDAGKTVKFLHFLRDQNRTGVSLIELAGAYNLSPYGHQTTGVTQATTKAAANNLPTRLNQQLANTWFSETRVSGVGYQV